MSIEPPPIDARTYRELYAEARARIPVHLPEWTNLNDADPGVTLLQLWAYMTESLLYRSALIPERNRVAFLRLLGYGRQPAQAARGLVTFTHQRPTLEPVRLAPDLEVAAGSVPFRTDSGLEVLPVEAKAYLKRTIDLDAATRAEVEEEYAAAYASFLDDGVDLAYYETTEVEWAAAERTALDLGDSIDGVLWLALLARTGDDVELVRDALANGVLTLGVVPDERADARALPPVGTPTASETGIEIQRPDAAEPLPSELAARVPRYVPVPVSGGTDLLQEPGVVELRLPDQTGLRSWDLDPNEEGVGGFPPALEGDAADRLVTWLRIGPAAAADGRPATPAPPRLRWVGINAAAVRQRTHVANAQLGRGDGSADQQVRLASTPVLLESVDLTVGGQRWRRVDDLMTADAEVPVPGGVARPPTDEVDRASVFTLDRFSGEVRFGDGIHGRRPPPGAVIAATYDHGGGRAGMVDPGAITTGVTLPTGIKVTNPTRTTGGAEAESVELAQARIAGHLRHRDRLVTEQDVREVAAATPGVELARIDVLPLLHPDLPEVTTPGVVTLVVVPRFDPVHPATPEPDRATLDAVCRHVDPRRLVTTELHLRGPRYRRVWVSIGAEPLPGVEFAVLRDAVERTLRSWCSPLSGGPRGTGWPLATDLERLELWSVAARADGVARIVDVHLAAGDGVRVDRVPLGPLELPRLVAVGVRRGEPQPVAELLGATPEVETTSLPIPFVPVEC